MLLGFHSFSFISASPSPLQIARSVNWVDVRAQPGGAVPRHDTMEPEPMEPEAAPAAVVQHPVPVAAAAAEVRPLPNPPDLQMQFPPFI